MRGEMERRDENRCIKRKKIKGRLEQWQTCGIENIIFDRHNFLKLQNLNGND